MTFFARVIEVITRTGGEVFDVVKVEATYGADAVQQICAAMQVEDWMVYLITEEEAMEWAALEIPIREIGRNSAA
jgi:ribosomal protein S28E/S33